MRVFLANHAHAREDATHLIATWCAACAVTGDQAFDGSTVPVPDGEMFDCGIIHDQSDKAAYIHDRRPRWDMWKQNAVVIFCSSVGVPTKPFLLHDRTQNKRINVLGVHAPFGQVSAEEWQEMLLWVRDVLQLEVCTLEKMSPRVLHLVRPLSFDYVTALGLLCDVAAELKVQTASVSLADESREAFQKKAISPAWWKTALGALPNASDVAEHVAYECAALASARKCPQSVEEVTRALKDNDASKLVEWTPRAHAAIKDILSAL